MMKKHKINMIFLSGTAILMLIFSCSMNEAEPERRVIKVSGAIDEEKYDEVSFLGVNAGSSDTIVIHTWQSGDKVPDKIYPGDELEEEFALLVIYKKDGIVYNAREITVGGENNGEEQNILEDFVPAPVIANRPEQIDLIFGQDTTLDMGVENTSLVEYAWFMDDDLLDSTPSFSFQAVDFSDTGDYLMIASNHAGADTVAFSLDVSHLVPRIANLQNINAQAGDSMEIAAEITHTDELIFTWIKDDSTVAEDSLLTVNGITREFEGDYQLIVENKSDGGVDSSNVFSIILDAALWNEFRWDIGYWN
jgi:hypothetical protein